jgi:hypothetical protein
MSENAIESENTSKPAPDTAKPKGARKAAKKAKSTKKGSSAKKPAAKPKADRTNKKAEVTGAHLPRLRQHPLPTFTLRRNGRKATPAPAETHQNQQSEGVWRRENSFEEYTPYRYRSPTPAKV